MKRSPMPRGSGFKKPERPPKAPPVLTPATRAATYAGQVVDGATPKDNPLRSEAYRRLVAALPCWMCGISGHSQAAHADRGKGPSLKADDRTCFPACGPHDGLCGCHYTIGSTGLFTRDERRAIEEQASRDTRATILAAGQWPKNLPTWAEKDEQQPATEKT